MSVPRKRGFIEWKFDDMTESALLNTGTEMTIAGEEFANVPMELPLTPLTDGQESLYILSRLAKDAPVYNMPFAFRLKGQFHFRAFHSALRILVMRHHALRSSIVETPQGLRQWTWSSDENVPLNFLDLSAVVDTERGTKLESELLERATAPFDLTKEAPFRADLIRISSDEHVALFTLHHAFGDMASMQVLTREFSELYNATVENREPSLPEAGLQMDAFAAQEAGKAPSQETLAFWRERLGTLLGDLELPADSARPRIPSFKGAAHIVRLPSTVAMGIKTIARANKCSSYAAFLAILQVLVYRYTNQRHFAIATPFSQRHDPALENTIGYLVNLLPIPCAPKPRATFIDLLADTRRASLEVFAHADISLRRILQEARVPADSPKNSLSRVVFQYLAEGPLTLELRDLATERMQFHSGTSKFDLSITMAESPSGIETEIEYDTDLFTAATIERLGQHLVNLTESIIRNPDCPIADVNLLTASEKCFLAELNETKTAYARDATIDQLFEQQVAANPTKLAISFEGTAITYLELNRRAEQVAQQLIRKGVRAGDFVGVCLERSPGLIAALLGILKAGAAFVPFDAKYPAARLQYMFSDSGVRVLIANGATRHIAPAGVEIVSLEEAAGEEISNIAKAAKPLLSPDSLGYMMYTSGSTGNPKGATVPHRAIIRLVRNNDFASFSPDEVFLLFAPISFDASTLEIWGPLLNGGTLAIYPPNFESLEQLADVLAREKVTTLWLSSGLFNTVVDRKVEALKGLRQLLVGGDVVSPAHVQKTYEACPDITIINGYGPTENTTFTCCYTIPRDWPAEKTIPIGRPIRNTQAYILDENLQPMPMGIPGELYCGGDGLSHGYWNKPDLTAQAFVPHPFAAGSRLYKTGDRVRVLPDGNIEFLGRLDSQIKIRGFRIELGEIETAFRQLPGVQDAAAVVESDVADGKRLLVFLIPKAGRTLDTSDLHEQVRKSLPEHACPSRIHVVEQFPLGPNGKVDKKALLALPVVTGPAASPATVQLTETEQAIARVWREILDTTSVGADENFFHLGGDSLRAIRAILQINRALNTNLGVSHMFEAPTIRGLAKKIDGVKATAMPSIRKSRIEPIRKRDVSALSDAEVNSLLNQMLKKEK